MPSQSSLLGAAGEHYVLCQLLRRGYIYDPARRGLYIGLLDLQKKLQLMQPEKIVELHAEVRGGSGHSGV